MTYKGSCLRSRTCTILLAASYVLNLYPLEIELDFRAFSCWQIYQRMLVLFVNSAYFVWLIFVWIFFTYGSNELGAAKGLIVVKISTSSTFLFKCRTFFLCVFCSTSATEITRYFSFLMILIKSVVFITSPFKRIYVRVSSFNNESPNILRKSMNYCSKSICWFSAMSDIKMSQVEYRNNRRMDWGRGANNVRMDWGRRANDWRMDWGRGANEGRMH